MDNILFERSLEAPPDTSSPFNRREMIKIRDIASAGNYSNGTVTFETVSLSNGGRWCDYTEAYITIPVVVVVSGVVDAGGAVVDFTVDHLKHSDMLLTLKNSYLNLINSCQIKYGNTSRIQQTNYINQYLIFKQHTEMSQQDEELHGPTIGYAKDTSNSWYYNDTNGVCNNKLGSLKPSALRHSAVPNSGMYKRAMFSNGVGDATSNQDSVLGADGSNLKQSSRNYIVNTATYKAFYYNAVLRLKDMPLFASFPSLLKGGNFRIELTLNQCKFTMNTTNALGVLNYSAYEGRQTNPVLVSAANYSSVEGKATDRQSVVSVIPSGAATLPASSTFTVTCSVARPQFTPHSGLGVPDCQELNCELHVPVYDLKPSFEMTYLQQGQKKIVYNEVILTILYNKQPMSTFNDIITNGVDHIKRLIIVPQIAAAGNGTQHNDPRTSPFDTCPSTCSPYILDNLQIQLANQNVYVSPVNYSYDMFLQEMNGRYGVESSLFPGVSSSMISMKDYVELYGYIVVDLKRKHVEDDSVALSVQISGRVKSLKALDLYCFIEQEKSFTIDIATGQALS